MDNTEYMLECRRTMSRTQADTRKEILASLAMGLCGEAGEVSEVLKKHLFHGKYPDPKAKLLEELGDLLWYATRIIDESGLSLEEVMTANIAKLRSRYPAPVPSIDPCEATMPDTPLAVALSPQSRRSTDADNREG